ncbi:MAG: MBL fold metallo-hydrolase, partial [Bryobacteraceae bacterium]|nr:MBL fold metallo-hydrolase [Bryobacteraceae bacterium]
DHVGGAAKLKKLTGAPVHMNAADGALLALMDVQAGWLGVATPDVTAVDVNARDGATVKLGETSMEILHTPGHTQGSVCVWIPAEGALVAGDTLFRESIGRTDLPGGDSRAIIRSIHEKLLVLPEEVRVFPGHGPSTTIGREKALNPFLR